MVAYGDHFDLTDVLAHHLCLLQADGEPKLFASICKAGDEPLESFFTVSSECCIIGEEQLSDEHSADFGLCSEAGEIEEVPVTPCVDKNSVFLGTKDMTQQQGEENPEEGGGEHASLLDSVGDGKGV